MDLTKTGEEHFKDLMGAYTNIDRAEILCGFTWDFSVEPCVICKRESCTGRAKKCKGFGAILPFAIPMKGI